MRRSYSRISWFGQAHTAKVKRIAHRRRESKMRCFWIFLFFKTDLLTDAFAAITPFLFYWCTVLTLGQQVILTYNINICFSVDQSVQGQLSEPRQAKKQKVDRHKSCALSNQRPTNKAINGRTNRRIDWSINNAAWGVACTRLKTEGNMQSLRF